VPHITNQILALSAKFTNSPFSYNNMFSFKVTATALLAAAAATPAFALWYDADNSLSTREVEELDSIYARLSEVTDELKARDLYGELSQNDARDIEDFLERRSLPNYDELVARDFDDELNLEAREYDQLLERYFDDLMERSDSSSDDSPHEGDHHHHHHHHHDKDSACDSHHKKHFKKRGFFSSIGAWFRKVFHAQTEEDKAYEKDLKEEKIAEKAAKAAKKAAKVAKKDAKKAAEKAHKKAEKAEKKVEHETSHLASEDSQQQKFSSSSGSSYGGSVSHHHDQYAQYSVPQSIPASSSGQDLYTGAANSGYSQGSEVHGAESYPPTSPAGAYGGGYQAREFEDLEERDEFDLEERDDFELEERDDLDGFDLQLRDDFDDLD
jgi:hypothetical protein